MKYSEENFVFGQVSYKYSMFFEWEVKGALVGVGAYLSLSLSAREVGWGGRLLTFTGFRIGAYSRWTLIRGWAPVQINMVCMVTSIARDKSRQLRGLGLGLDFLQLFVISTFLNFISQNFRQRRFVTGYILLTSTSGLCRCRFCSGK